MGMVVFTGQIDFEQYPTVQVGVRATDGDGPLTEIAVTGIIDTASKQCVINVGVFAEGFFAPTNGVLVNGIGHSFDSRYREMVVRLMHKEITKEFGVPVYEMPLGTFPGGARVMLIGRTILNQGVLVYDGTNRTWRMTFSSD